jgi:hypothetical protein
MLKPAASLFSAARAEVLIKPRQLLSIKDTIIGFAVNTITFLEVMLE